MNPRIRFTRSFIPARLGLLTSLVLLAGATLTCQGPSADEVAVVRLYQLEGALLNGSEQLFKTNADRVRRMEAQARAGARPADLATLAQAQALHDSTRALIDHLRTLREQLNQHTRNSDPLAQLATRGAVGELMQTPKGPADGLQHLLRRYGSLLQQTAPAAHAGHAPGFEPFDFGATSLAGALAALARYETEVLLQEHGALDRLQSRLTPTRLQAALHPFVSAQASTVAPGETYRAQVSLASVRYHPGALTMTANGQAIPVGPDGIGEVVLPAAGPSRKLPAYWAGTITVHVGARDSTFHLRVPYPPVK